MIEVKLFLKCLYNVNQSILHPRNKNNQIMPLKTLGTIPKYFKKNFYK